MAQSILAKMVCIMLKLLKNICILQSWGNIILIKFLEFEPNRIKLSKINIIHIYIYIYIYIYINI